MTIAVLQVRIPEPALPVADGVPSDRVCIAFDSIEMLQAAITPNRLRLLDALCGDGPVSVLEAARRVGREPTQVQADLMALLRVGVLVQKAQSVQCPYDSIEVDLS